MKAFVAALLAALSLCAIGCDMAELKDAPSALAQAGVDVSLPPPEPARFAKPGPPKADSAVAQAASAAAPVVASAGEEGVGGASSVFDGARTASASAVQPLSSRAPIVRTAKMSIDTDGQIASRADFERVARRDRWRQNATSLRYADGRSLDPTRVPYVVLPKGYQGASLGDLVYVEYKGRGAWAVAGDYGPANRFGEASSALAEKLGIDPDGLKGGVSSGVRYTIYPGTGRGAPADEASLTQSLDRGPTLLASGPSSVVAL